MKSSASAPHPPTSEPSGANVRLFAILLEQLNRLGLHQVVLAPGSRSTPLAVALATAPLSVSVCLDERAAAFFACGLARRSGAPVMVVTTSGTASLELLPALAEASLSGLPLLLVTADRPTRLKGVSAPQTLDQIQAMASFVRATISLEFVSSLTPRDLASVALQLVTELGGAPNGPGPVHLNVGIEEPLLGQVVEDEQRQATVLQEGARRGDIALHRPLAPRLAALDPEVANEIFRSGRSGWLLLGGVSESTHETIAAAEAVTNQLGWTLAVDARTPLARRDTTVIHLDLLTRGSTPTPEVVVVIGDFPLARSSMNALRRVVEAGGDVVTLGDRFVVRDPGRFVTAGYVADVESTLQSVLTESLAPVERSPVVSERVQLLALDQSIDRSLQNFAQDHPATEIAVARALYGLLGGDEALFSSASMPIRYLDQFRGYHSDPPLVAMNRGANGIDGVLSSYLGFAHAEPQRLTALLVGDLATLYDVSALIHLPLPSRGLIVVLDNQGGLIFDQVPPAASIAADVQTEFFVTPPRVRPASVLEGMGFEVTRITAAADLAALVQRSRNGEFLIAVLEGTRAASHEALGSLYAQIDHQLAKEQRNP
ncbi:2-succinyl-5-enolpyruvyl-6-hydroxy-3-cyclohexene-1-carboxylic-acid synthase [Ferrimicrobium sp.]|uniref:2-succinyl-5-enolpyruvyl-6-hydroxy-3- cyclohexene-1-carboxylic-acid synthase n=1 Tax=Ferrimicrobium sp. TaxID=2926050 RepID=UPI002616F09A|nr:2-succinyl-5-enolpyruvyl-6-hydroxy-3-cyclohexene-1-carboxylic-acid synthase [Ferrimicrobium sp.]